MIRDPYETNNIIEQYPEVRRKLATLWNEWNAGNQHCYLLQSGAYQKKRLQMYKELNTELKKKQPIKNLVELNKPLIQTN